MQYFHRVEKDSKCGLTIVKKQNFEIITIIQKFAISKIKLNHPQRKK